ncbi:MAG: hypothetical protein JOZ60_03145 [Verrucomicrobia bacterium]|nr:hypothetical protein [Verrucomicrobiota bacterium]
MKTNLLRHSSPDVVATPLGAYSHMALVKTQALSNFLARGLIPWPQYFDGGGWENEFATKYDVRAIPELWLIDQRGELVSTDLTAAQLDQRIEQLMSAGDKLSRD